MFPKMSSRRFDWAHPFLLFWVSSCCQNQTQDALEWRLNVETLAYKRDAKLVRKGSKVLAKNDIRKDVKTFRPDWHSNL